MKAPCRATITLPVLVALLGLAVPGAATPPTPVSPGEIDRATEVPGGCPSFSWTLDERAAGYEIVVVTVSDGEPARLALERRIGGSALSWSPDRAACLAAGTYAWSVRSLDAEGQPLDAPEPWARPRAFAVPAAPGPEEVAAALDTLRRWQASQDPRATAGSSAAPAAVASDRSADAPTSSFARAPGALPERPASVAVSTSAGAAMRGENPTSSGEEHGVLGLASSPQGAGLAAVNTTAGPDLVLDGARNGEPDALLSQSGLDRPSSSDTGFDFRNSQGGAMQLTVDGVAVVTTATDRDALGELACAAGEIPLRGSNLWTCGPGSATSYLAGNQLQLIANSFHVVEGSGSGLDADSLDGLDASAFATATHDHFGETWLDNAPTGLQVTNGYTSSSARGVVGEVVAQGGVGLEGVAAAPNGLGTGVLGRVVAMSGDGAGVEGTTPSPAGTGVVGRATATSGAPRGVYGESASGGSGAGIHGVSLSDSGSGVGVLGVGNSPAGVGVVARNSTAGADLRLDGDGTNSTRADLTEAALDRASNQAETFDFRNSGSGAMTLTVDGIPVTTVDTDQDVLGDLACAVGEVPIRQLGSWTCAPSGGTAYLAGNQLSLTASTFHVAEGPGSGLDADTVDGLEPSQLAALGHDHFGQLWTGHGEEGLWVSNGSVDAFALRGTASASVGQSNGVEGVTNSENGYGVEGWATTGTGINAGVFGRSNSTQGVGVDGYASATTGRAYGVRGVSASSTDGAAGVYGEGAKLGLQGVATGIGAAFFSAMGVMGYASSPTGVNGGVVGFAKSPEGSGIVGWGPYGSGPNRAGVFFGNVEILGTVTASSKSFRIDHPLDPAHKLLEHASIESSERLNLYTGNVTIGAGGTATVQLPDWFAALNTELPLPAHADRRLGADLDR
jgi:hypothetical protein